MKGFNFKEHKILGMPKDYKNISLVLDYENLYLSQNLIEGSNNIIEYFGNIQDILEPKTNYFISIYIDSKLATADVFLLFSAFMNSFKGTKNAKDYLITPDRVKQYMGGAEYSATQLMNQDFEMGTIQLHLTTNGETYEWIRD